MSSTDPRKLTAGQRAYEARRAAKAGMSLEKWLAEKHRRAREDAIALAATGKPAADPPRPAGRQGFFARLLERAQKPL